MFDAEHLHVVGLVRSGDVGGDQFLLPRGQRFHILEPAIDRGRMAVVRDKRIERLDQMPGGAVDSGHQARMNVLVGTLAALLPARDQLQLDRALGAEEQGGRALDRLAARGNDDPDRFFQRGLDLGIGDDLMEMGRGDRMRSDNPHPCTNV